MPIDPYRFWQHILSSLSCFAETLSSKIQKTYKQSLKCQSIPIDFDNTYCRVCHASLKHCRPKFKKLDPLVHLFLSRTPCCHTPHHIFCSYDTIQNGFKICKLCLHTVKCFNWKLIKQYMLEPKWTY